MKLKVMAFMKFRKRDHSTFFTRGQDSIYLEDGGKK
jgi:hypothetical protein